MYYPITKYILTFGITVCLLTAVTDNANAAEDSAKDAQDNTIEEKMDVLEKKLIDIEKSIANLSIGMNAIKENLTVYLIKKDKSFEITYLELLIHDKSWYKHIFTQEESAAIENASIGKMLTRFIWSDIKKRRSKIKIRCFYRNKDDESRKEYKIIKEFNITSRTKVSNLLSVTIKKIEDKEGKKKVDISINFW